jgi:exodeoxyribonuclease V beta subunit
VTRVPPGISLLPASAGTGKTWNIAEAVLDLVLEEGIDIRRLVVVTFSEAAARELRERIRLRFADLRRGVLAGDRPWVWPDTAMEQRVQRCGPEHAERAWQALVHFDEACIDTIHGFCSRVLLQAAFECGAPLGTNLLAELGEVGERVVEDFWIRQTWAATPETISSLEALKLDTKTLADLARKASDPTLVVVPPSPGAVEAPDVKPWEDALARVRSIWRRERSEITRLLTESPDLVRRKTRAAPVSLPAGRTGDLLDSIAEWERNAAPGEALPECVEQLCGKNVALATIRGRTPPAHDFLSALDTLCAAHASVQPALRRWRLSLQHRLVDEVRGRLGHELARRNALTFDALLRAVRDPVVGRQSVRDAIRRRYALAIVDEFQDTDGVQWDIFRTLFPDRLFLVGDPKQAIYGFRGGDFATFRRAMDECTVQEGLTKNYRTDGPLVAAVHHLFARPGAIDPMFDPAIDFPRVSANQPEPGDERPPLHIRFLPRDEGRTWERVLKKKPLEKDLPAIVANDVVRELRRGKVEPGDCAVLTRTNEQASCVARELQLRGVPATVRADAPVTEEPEQQALLDVLRAIEAPLDTRKVRKALVSMLFGVTAAELVALQGDSEKWIEHTGRFRAWKAVWETRGIFATVQAILEGGVAERLLREGRERSVVNVRHLAEILQRGAHLAPTALLAWLEHGCPGVEKEDLALRLDTDAEAVQVVTVHGAKGLEYSLVWVPFLVSGTFLHSLDEAHLVVNDPDAPGVRLLDLGSDRRPRLEEQALFEKRAEDLRLTYVALTRARHRCVVYWGVRDKTSPLGWLLHQRADMETQNRAAVVESRLLKDDSVLMADLDALAPVITWDKVDWNDTKERATLLPREAGEVPEGRRGSDILLPRAAGEVLEGRRGRITAATFGRAGRLDTLWRRGSFTGLTRGVIHEWRVDTSEGDRVPLADVRGGARFGTLVHELLETYDFRSELIATAFDDTGVVARSLAEALRAPVLPDGFTMMNVGPRFTELAFHLPVADPSRAVTASAIASLFDGPFGDRLRALEFVPLRGFLVGSMDLAFRHGGRWYIVDWKTNDLGATWSCYDRAGMDRAMLEHLYPLQYHLYTVALTRVLRARVPDFDYERDFGGALYLFLRGMSSAHPGSGVYFERPSAELITRLDSLLSEGA